MGGSEGFVNVWTSESNINEDENENFYRAWNKGASAKHVAPDLIGYDDLRKAHPKHSITMTTDYKLNLHAFPHALMAPLASSELITNVKFIPLQRQGPEPGILIDDIRFGGFKLAWDIYDFIVYIVPFPKNFTFWQTQTYILHEGSSQEPARALLKAAGAYSEELHEEIWVFDGGFWDKDRSLWLEMRKADWKDVILEEEKKEKLQKDIYGFFESEHIYKDLAIPWKRGIIMYGPPGNGKTISIKAIMRSCDDKNLNPLYVKSFKSFAGDEWAMAQMFQKARQLSPCIIILEDLDSLINDSNRSFFLNQMDGLSGNDGLLIIGTTNHFERLDPGLSTRPSRFDRKYNFDDPNQAERLLYVQYWQRKLAKNKDILFPDSLAQEIAQITGQFSFAYLKEAFVSTLVQLAGIEGKKPSFAEGIKETIADLRKQLDKTATMEERPHASREVKTVLDALSNDSLARQMNKDGGMQAVMQSLDGLGFNDSVQADSDERNIRALLDELSHSVSRVARSDRIRMASSSPPFNRVFDNGITDNERSIKSLLDAVVDSASSRKQKMRMYEAGNSFA